VSATQPGCPWDAPHLHQSARVSAETPFYTNALADPTEDDEWVHAIMWESGGSDSDGDGWTNENELSIGTDPFDNCPDNYSDEAWPPDLKLDWCINVADVVKFTGHIPCYYVGDACYENRFDLKTDGEIGAADVLKLRPYIINHQCCTR